MKNLIKTSLLCCALASPAFADMPQEDRDTSVAQVNAQIGSYLAYRSNVSRYAGLRLGRNAPAEITAAMGARPDLLKDAFYDSIDGWLGEVRSARTAQLQSEYEQMTQLDAALTAELEKRVPGFRGIGYVTDIRVAYANEGLAGGIQEVTLIAAGELVSVTLGETVGTVTMPVARGTLNYARQTFEGLGASLYDSGLLR